MFLDHLSACLVNIETKKKQYQQQTKRVKN